jgi:hypothetical protein
MNFYHANPGPVKGFSETIDSWQSLGAAARNVLAFVARAEARALLWKCRELDLHEAVDELQIAAEKSGLIDQLGQDRVQGIIAKAFRAVR